jgi:hypothetical protein
MGMDKFVGVVLLLVLLAACAQTPPPTATPEPPTATPPPAATSTPFIRPTLPPEWTPTDTPTEPAAPPTPTDDPRVQQLLDNPSAPGVCDTFAADPQRNIASVVAGSSVQVFWQPALDAAQYELGLFDDRGFRIDVIRTPETTHLFDAELFQPGRTYGWIVIPFSSEFEPLCLPQGGEFRVEFPTITPAP